MLASSRPLEEQTCNGHWILKNSISSTSTTARFTRERKENETPSIQRLLFGLPAFTTDHTNAHFAELRCFPLRWPNPRQLGISLLASCSPWEKPARLPRTLNIGMFHFCISQTGKVAKFMSTNHFQMPCEAEEISSKTSFFQAERRVTGDKRCLLYQRSHIAKR